jgi:hypothetical protein
MADDVHAAAVRAARLAYAIVDGTLIPIDRVADQKPYYSGSTNATASIPGAGRPGRYAGRFLTAAHPGSSPLPWPSPWIPRLGTVCDL